MEKTRILSVWESFGIALLMNIPFMLYSIWFAVLLVSSRVSMALAIGGTLFIVILGFLFAGLFNVKSWYKLTPLGMAFPELMERGVYATYSTRKGSRGS